jgi:hypothetical protein
MAPTAHGRCLRSRVAVGTALRGSPWVWPHLAEEVASARCAASGSPLPPPFCFEFSNFRFSWTFYENVCRAETRPCVAAAAPL